MPWEGVQPPAEPAGYDPANKYADPVVYFKHREAKVAAEYVKVAEAKLIRKKLKQCYKESGVNYQQNCRELAQNYLAAIKGVGIYRANAGPHEEPRWEFYNVGKK
ncbi:NADH dehydrogenase [ubiquinone] 1 beta subcomplex subunit 10-B-like [Micractinium conductrix]|uniref:NADH dehydrogenase [ubiquinone] 1 beta subcomplex subunit 10-B-like n=1 Tax=Micractinium conductrix TaxID=554055 RepID=A0A2P6VR53_9CHLO|nr:NADH dehydrogenase [ubiquinone] 1 beta subcomplex subunit 10-B-like [Micractinium conductrix]|eukprot:PSC76562.1 NADH dehydrogenase [ubiquinone] 1 beta subcomplex subunit 10-B-like [Micractinium conductrix]